MNEQRRNQHDSRAPGFRSSAPAHLPSTLHVLIVDDDPFIRATLKQMALNAGAADVAEVADGKLAIQIVSDRTSDFDVIFCDLQMPGCDGIETLRGFAGVKTRSNIVLMSGEDKTILTAAENVARAQKLRVLGSITKPFYAAQIAALLASVTAAAEPVQKTGQTQSITDADIQAGLQNGEFFVLFQPKVSVASRGLSGVEALVRWKHKDLGLISPLLFVPVAEASDTIDTLTEFVLHQALDAQAAWRADGYSVPIAVNLSTRSMTKLDLPDRLSAIVKTANASPSSIILEVTESRLPEDISAFLDIATRLRLKGFRLAIDDFGTGFSTLEQLSRLPVSELKIDRAFVAGSPSNEKIRAILETSLALARRLGLVTVCEGAETQSEWELIARLGGDYIQGYYVAKPMRANELIGWFKSWQ